MARIEGKGEITLLFKNDEHRSFAGAYYIPRLTTNIVSLNQLDEAGSLTNRFRTSLKHKNVGQTKFIKPNSQR